MYSIHILEYIQCITCQSSVILKCTHAKMFSRASMSRIRPDPAHVTLPKGTCMNSWVLNPQATQQDLVTFFEHHTCVVHSKRSGTKCCAASMASRWSKGAWKLYRDSPFDKSYPCLLVTVRMLFPHQACVAFVTP